MIDAIARVRRRRALRGVLIALGRKDRQVKINGQRAEPAEIEAVLRQAPGVVDAIVLPRTDAPPAARLAFVAAGTNADPSLGAALRQSLRARLPGHMMPAASRTRSGC